MKPPGTPKKLPANIGDQGGEDPLGGGNGNPLQYCLENSMDRGAWWATVHGVAESQDMTVSKAIDFYDFKFDLLT